MTIEDSSRIVPHYCSTWALAEEAGKSINTILFSDSSTKPITSDKHATATHAHLHALIEAMRAVAQQKSEQFPTPVEFCLYTTSESAVTILTQSQEKIADKSFISLQRTAIHLMSMLQITRIYHIADNFDMNIRFISDFMRKIIGESCPIARTHQPTSVRTTAVVPTPPITQTAPIEKKVAAQTLSPPSIRGLAATDRNKPANTASEPKRKLDSFPFKIVDVTKTRDNQFGDPFDKFVAAWEAEPRFSWALAYHSRIRDIASSANSTEDMFSFLPEMHNVFAFCVCWSAEVVFVIPLQSNNANKLTKRWTTIKRIMESPDKLKIQWDCKSQVKILLSQGVQALANLFDPKIASWVLEPDENKDKDLDSLYQSVAFMISREVYATATYLNKKGEAKCLPPWMVDAVWKCHQSWCTSLGLETELEKDDNKRLRSIFYDIEMPMVALLAEMEFWGIGFQPEKFRETQERMKAKLEYLTKRIFAYAKRTFEIGSWLELSHVLYDELKLPCLLKTKGGKRSTNKAALMLIRDTHPIIDLILEYRLLSHTINTYTDSLPKFSYYNQHLKMTRIYATYQQTAVPTGRLAVENPNLQSIRHEFTYVPVAESPAPVNQSPSKSTSSSNASFSTPVGTPIEVNIRNSFIATPGMVLVSADYSQLELRIMAHLSQDPSLLEKFKQNTTDIFRATASHWFKKAEEDVTDFEREQTKTLCYGILYGKGVSTTALDLGVTVEQATELMRDFKRSFPGLQSWIENTLKECRNTTYTETILGRRRYHKGIIGATKGETAAAERQAINSVAQGSAADIAKRSMLAVHNYFKRMANGARILVNIHDELLVEVPETHLVSMATEIQRLMEHTTEISVPLPVKIRVGFAWGSLMPLEEFLETYPSFKTFGR